VSPAAVPPRARRLLARFLDAACDGAAGGALYRLLTPDAPVHRGGAWLPRSAEAREVFAARHRELDAAGGAALPHFADGRALAWEPGAAGDGVLWFEALERRSARPVTGALGLRAERSLQVAWATLAEHPASWGFAAGRARTLANLAWMALSEPAAARTPLDAAWFRLHWLPDGLLEGLPGLRFQCRGSTTCCRQDYLVAMPAGAQALIDALPWERIAPRLAGTQLRALPGDRVEIKARDESCRFLGATQQCLIHAELGYQPFGPCAAFPFSFAATPEGIAVSASRSCGSVCDGHGATVAERDRDLRQRLAVASLRRASSYRLAPERPVDWPRFRDTEAALRALLARTELPLHERLRRGLRLLAGHEREGRQEAPPVALDQGLTAALAELLERIMRWDRIALRTLPPTIPRDLRHVDLREPEALASELVALHFSKIYSYEFDLTTAHNFGILLYLLALSWQRALPAGLDALRRRELALLGSHGLLAALLAGDAPAPFRTLLGSVQFGEWALAYAAA
jgi:hypothetical protein